MIPPVLGVGSVTGVGVGVGSVLGAVGTVVELDGAVVVGDGDCGADAAGIVGVKPLCCTGSWLAELIGAFEAEIGCGVVLEPPPDVLLFESEPEVSEVDAPKTFPPL